MLFLDSVSADIIMVCRISRQLIAVIVLLILVSHTHGQG